MAVRYNPPPNWPAPPAGWTPAPGWRPDPAWGPAPEGWQLWVDEPDLGPIPDETEVLPAAHSTVPGGGPERASLDPAGERSARPWFKRKRFIVPGALLVLVIAIGALGGGGGAVDRPATAGGGATEIASESVEKSAEELAAEAEASASAEAEAERLAEERRLAEEQAAEQAAAEAAAAEAAAAEAAAAEAARVGTLSQQNAYRQSKNYLDNLPFSRAGLLGQLTSEYGGQFSAEDAEFGVARIEAEGGVDWFAEAVEAAQQYQESIPMSRQGLIDQLTSQYGSQFTVEQATHAVDTLGL